MGSVVGAFGQGHILLDDHGVESRVENILQGFKYIGEKVRSLNPDVVVIVSDDHMLNVGAAQQIPLGVCVSDLHRPMGDMDIPTELEFAGHREFAEGFMEFAAQEGFDLAKLETEGYRPDHGVALPALFVTPKGDIPIVPILCNINMTPSPTPKRCWKLGAVMKEYIEKQRADGERVVVIATGGLSHWLQIEGDGQLNEDWDREMLNVFASGDAEKLTELSTQEIQEQGGNGGTEIKNWLVMAATVPQAKGEVLFYEPMYSWKTGMGAVELLV